MDYIKEFQLINLLEPDGVIGPKTLDKIRDILQIKTDEQLAHFMGQCAHESGDFKVMQENLNYSANRLLQVFKKYFNYKTCKEYAHKPERIGNRIYANRMGNGDEASGDGYKHRGFGFIQLTGKNNHYAFSEYIKNPSIKNKPYLIGSVYPFESAKYFFDVNNIWKYTDKVDDESILKVSKIVNLGNVSSKIVPNGLADRINKTKMYYDIIKNGKKV